MAGPDSWMPFYFADFWGDTLHLNTVEQCAYFNLLCAMWKAGGSLPNDNARLQRLSRVTEKEWATASVAVTAFFVCENGTLTQKRLSKEYAKALKAYTGRSDHIRTVNSNRKQSPSTVSAPNDSHTAHNSHSPDGENHPSDDLAASRPKPKRGTTIPPDWKPSEKDILHATTRGISQDDLPEIAEHFRDHHTAHGTVSKDWSASWRTWIANHKRFARGGNAGERSKTNTYGRSSVTAARDRILAKAGVRPHENGSSNHQELRPDTSGGIESHRNGEAHSGPIVDADEWQRVPGPADGTEGAHPAVAGHDGGPGGAAHSVPKTLHGLPGRRGEVCAQVSTRDERLVAGVVGTEGTARDTHIPPAHDAQSTDQLEIPAFLKGPSPHNINFIPNHLKRDKPTETA